MDEPGPNDPKPPQSRWKFWLTLSSVASGVLIWLGISIWREIDPIVEPTPEALIYQVTDEQRATLSPKVLELLEKIEARGVSGKAASDIADVLAEANETRDGKRFRRYLFSIDGHTGYLEGHPVIYVQVQLKTGRIIRCGVSVPCF